MTYLLIHQCVCGEDWEREYLRGAVVDPECPNCGRGLEVVRPKRKTWYENITSELKRA